MIAFSNTGTGFKGAISYVLKEHEKDLPHHQKPVVIAQNNIWGTSSSDMAKQMRFIAHSNAKSSRPVLHIAFSFHKEEKLTLQESMEAMHMALKEINFQKNKNQYLLVKHNDTDVEHYHWVINKVDLDSKNLDTSYIKNRLQVACDKVEKLLKLRYTEGRTIVFDPTAKQGYKFTKKTMKKNKIFHDKASNVADVKQFIHGRLIEVMSRLDNVQNLEKELEKHGIECKASFNVNGLAGVSFKYNHQAYKGSQIGVKAKDIVKAVHKNSIDKLKEQIRILNEFNMYVGKALSNISIDYEKGNIFPDFAKHFNAFDIHLEKDYIRYKGCRLPNAQIENFRKVSETYVSATLKDFEYQVYVYNELMKKKPKDVPLLFGRDKIITENNRILQAQERAVKPVLKIRIENYTVPNFTMLCLRAVKKIKENIVELTGEKTKSVNLTLPKKKETAKIGF